MTAPRLLALLWFASSSVLVACGDGGGDGPRPPGPTNPGPSSLAVCSSIEPIDTSAPDVTLTGADCNEDALRGAIDGAADGARIVLDCGSITLDEQLVVRRSLTLDGSDTTVLDGGGSTRIFQKLPGATLNLQRLTLQNGRAPNPRSDAFSMDNWYEFPGGLVLAQGHEGSNGATGGEFQAVDVTFLNGDATPSAHEKGDMSGGAVYLFAVPEARFLRCRFEDNRAILGGALAWLGSSPTVVSSTFVNNEAVMDSALNPDVAHDNRGYGGAVYADGTEQDLNDDPDHVIFCNNVFQGNTADRDGGAMHLFTRTSTGLTMILDGNTFEANETAESGGGFSYYRDPSTHLTWPTTGESGQDFFLFSRNTLSGNRAARNGGALYVFNFWTTESSDVRAAFVYNTVSGNQVLGDGGGDNSFGWGAAGFFQGMFGVLFAHNTVVHNRSENLEPGWLFGSSTSGNSPYFVNNLFTDNVGANGSANLSGFDVTQANVDPARFVGNLYAPREFWDPGSAVEADPLLSPLADNGGVTHTHLLGAGSPAVDAGEAIPSGFADFLELIDGDQRGEPALTGSAPDIGAVEAP